MPTPTTMEERFDEQIRPLIDNPLIEFNFSEGHKNPKLCVEEDIKNIKSFIQQEIELAKKEEQERIVGIIKGKTLLEVGFDANSFMWKKRINARLYDIISLITTK